ASDPARKRIVRVQLATGLIDQELSFALTPGAIALTPDGTRLVLALVRQRSADREGSGAVAEIDPVAFAIVRQRDLPMDPFDLVATDAYEANRAVIQRWIHPTSEIVLTPLGQASGSGFQVRAAGWPGREIVLEGSPDLIVWLPISTNSIGDGPLLIRDLQPAPAGRFYRARIIQ